MANSELGSKHLCTECGARFYDLGRQPPTCPKCETVVVATTKPRPSRSRPPRAARKPAPVKEAAVEVEIAKEDKADDEKDDTPVEKASEDGDSDDESPAAVDEPERGS